jgi:hypothetical protein
MSKKDAIKKVQKKYGGTTPQERPATQQRIEADMQKLPPHVRGNSTPIVPAKWNAYLTTFQLCSMLICQPKNLTVRG